MKKIFVLILIAFSFMAHAGGSFRLDSELLPVLDKNPELKRVVLTSFDFAESGGANRIGYSVNKKLGGRRIGPYYLNAKPKGESGSFTLTVIFHTKIEFVNSEGKETSDIVQAVDIRERFYSYEVLPLGKNSASFLNNQF